ncbi:hypothetical protein MKW98_025590 [Papaver atlanticum]|uniref:Uncharacterized protein n=1 Tax=Papaver atlanticum TaxID=357466 RepID=A0AAD4XB98_9MAGN|nr:hypothetical protein MKW98_025590 [Papaver atlanticum]
MYYVAMLTQVKRNCPGNWSDADKRKRGGELYTVGRKKEFQHEKCYEILKAAPMFCDTDTLFGMKRPLEQKAQRKANREKYLGSSSSAHDSDDISDEVFRFFKEKEEIKAGILRNTDLSAPKRKKRREL